MPWWRAPWTSPRRRRALPRVASRARDHGERPRSPPHEGTGPLRASERHQQRGGGRAPSQMNASAGSYKSRHRPCPHRLGGLERAASVPTTGLCVCLLPALHPRGGSWVAGCKLRPQRNGEVAGCRKTRTGTSGCRFHGRARPARIPRGTPRRAMQSFEYRSVRYWSKEINGTLTGGRKK